MQTRARHLRACPRWSACAVSSPLLTPDEIREIAGGYEQPRRQLQELRRQGFWRARLSRSNAVILERAHYEAVCAGAAAPGQTPPCEAPRPQVRVRGAL